MPTDHAPVDSDETRYRRLNRIALIVAALVAIGGTIALIPVFLNVREKQHGSSCNDHLRGTGHWFRTLGDRGEELPPIRDVRDYLRHYRDQESQGETYNWNPPI